MSLRDNRRRLPVVASLPRPDDRRARAGVAGEVPSPRYAVWELTLKCDQKCIHCGSRAGAARPGELSTAEALQLVADLRALGVGEVTLIGGEAYLRDDFILIARAIRNAGMDCTMTTGGLNLTEERVAALAEAGVRSVNLSIDGTEAAHDALRGVPGSFRRAFAALERLRAAGVARAVNTQINRLTLPTLEALQSLLLAEGIGGWQLQITAPFGNAADHPEILLQPFMLLEVFAVLERLVARGAPHGQRLWPANNLGYFGPLEAELRGRQKAGGHYKGCIAGRHALGIEADGTIKGCPSLGGRANAAGNVRERPLREIWDSAPELQFTRKRTVDDLWGYCRECYYNDVCMAGCSATSEPLLGRPGNNPYCHHRALELDRAGLRERVEPVAPAPGVPFDHGLYRVVREAKDPELAARGPVAIDEPRVGREQMPFGPGAPVPRS
ncbi:radical SAM/SPASM domain-containing protein [Nannocystis pusilla]|uniref:Radical SAM protein n=1 Tax=Nannocystis pusilla TaxID=889268 RepID=A0ABS7U404_9BACT|nr:radical SAM protein [Nannocystis pusilla]